MAYVDGFLLAVKKDRIEDYKRIAAIGATLWQEFGASNVVECIGDDVPYGTLTSFPRAVQATDDEVVVFSWIVYDTKETRDNANARIMTDPRMEEAMRDMPVDGKRMIFGGFVPFLGL